MSYTEAQDKTLILTTLKCVSPTIEWTIEDISNYVADCSIQSPKFNLYDTTYDSYLTFQESDTTYDSYLTFQESGGTISINLLSENSSGYSNSQKPPFKYTIAFLNSKRNRVKEFVPTYSPKIQRQYYNQGRSSYDNGSNWSKEEIFDKESDILVNNSLTIVCEINLAKTNTVHEIKKISKSMVQPEGNILVKLVEDFSKVMNSSNLSDVTLFVGEKKFHTHKVILAARSPVFAAMFKNEMKEAETNVVEISDVSPSVMQEVISFIYTGRSPNLKDQAEEVLLAADYYDLRGLMEMCEIEMLSQLKVENAIKFLVLADTYKLISLRKKVMAFVASNLQEVFKSRYWEEIVNSKTPISLNVRKTFVESNLFNDSS